MSSRKQENLRSIFPDLNRPEYPPSPDVLLSSLLYPFVSKGYSPVEAVTLEDKWISYKWLTSRNQSRVHETRPSLDTHQELVDFCSLLESCGLHIDPNDEAAKSQANALLGSIKGVSGLNAKSEIAVALSPAIAALQDSRGAFAKNNPPNYERIFHQMASLGAGHAITPGSLGKQALDALESAESARVTKLVDRFFKERASGAGPEVVCATASHVPAWLGGLETPYTWFNASWSSLCSGGWIERMPNRRWCDWASCVLRTVAGMGFLWEAAFYVRLGRCIDSDSDLSAAEKFARDPEVPLLSWLPRSRRVTERSVNEQLKATIGKGLAVKEVIFKCLYEDDDLPGTTADWQDDPSAIAKFIKHARDRVSKDQSVSSALSRALSASTKVLKGGEKNTYETVRYSLSQRREMGREADFYYLSKTSSRRYLVVEPGQEWLVVVASLASREAGGCVTLQDVAAELSKLGLAPGRQQLTALLEECGLTRSCRDAEQAIEVAAAF